MVCDDLREAGIECDLQVVTIGELQQNFIRTKNYDSILIGESYTGAADPYVYWHGAAIKDPGLNLSLYSNSKVNKLLEDARQILDPVKRAAKLQEFQKVVISQAPAAFLYSPNYIYIADSMVKNINLKNLAFPSNRFSKVNEWYIETDRIWK